MAATDTTCVAFADAAGEPVAATTNRTDRWLLVEVHGQWAPDAIETEGLGGPARARVREWLAATPESRLLLIRRPERRDAAGIHVVIADSRPGHESLRCAVLAAHDDLAAVDLADASFGEPVTGPLLLVCHHGRRDACCARLGRPLYEALVAAAGRGAPTAAAAAGPVWQCSHVGGHRFAGNVVWLPEGITLGRVQPEDAGAVLAGARVGRIPLANLRGRSSHAPAAQAADGALRAELGLDGVGDVTVAAVVETADGFEVRLIAGATERTYAVSRSELFDSLGSCGDEPTAISRLVATRS